MFKDFKYRPEKTLKTNPRGLNRKIPGTKICAGKFSKNLSSLWP
jgi:hypothetical protein